LTKRLGLYTSLRSNGRWHDSMSAAQWRIEQNENGIIKASGKWLYLPVSQTWEIGLREANILELKISMDADQEIEFDRLQTNLMVSERYSQWIGGGKKSGFPVFNSEIDDEWDIVYSEKNGKHISVTSSAVDRPVLPLITLLPGKLNFDYRLNIINSDVYHRGRVLQCLDINKKLSVAGNYLYFSGKFIIGEQPD
jgi:hypothetical protein